MGSLAVALNASDAADAGRFGPKAANLAALSHAGLPTPGGVCVDAAAYRQQLETLGVEEQARGVLSDDLAYARRCAVAMRLALLEGPLPAETLEVLRDAWHTIRADAAAPGVVRSSALVEDRLGASFAGQFESYLGLQDEAEFLTAVRACWAALWSTRVLRYIAGREVDPAGLAMALLVQPLVAARCSGGGLSRTAQGGLLLSATRGLGDGVAQGTVVPDRYVLDDAGALLQAESGHTEHRHGCVHAHHGPAADPAHAPAGEPCLDGAEVQELARLLRRAEAVMGLPVEIEWALDDRGFQLLQARPLQVQSAPAADGAWAHRAGLRGQPAGSGWSSGRACVINCECELSRVAPGDVLVTTVASPALSSVLPRVAGVVAELGGSTSHLASLARERNIPMVLGVLNATQRIPDGAQVAVDGVTGTVRWVA